MGKCEHTIDIGELRVWSGVVTPPPYDCVFCELKRVQTQLEASQEELAAVRSELSLVEMARDAIAETMYEYEDEADRMRPVFEATMRLHGDGCRTYGFCEQCFDRCGDCSPPYGHREDCPNFTAEEELSEAIVQARNRR